MPYLGFIITGKLIFPFSISAMTASGSIKVLGQLIPYSESFEAIRYLSLQYFMVSGPDMATLTPASANISLFLESTGRSASKRETIMSIFLFLHSASRNGMYSLSYIRGVIKYPSAALRAGLMQELDAKTRPFPFRAFLKYSTIYVLLPALVKRIFM